MRNWRLAIGDWRLAAWRLGGLAVRAVVLCLALSTLALGQNPGTGPADRIVRAGGRVQVNSDGSVSIIPAAGKTVSSAGFWLNEIATPATPPANTVRIYAKDKSGVATLYYKRDDGTEVELGASVDATVVSVFGRVGAVVASTNDYTWAQINKATSSLADIATRAYSDLQGVPSTFAPSAHASAHASAGADPVTVAQSQVTGLAAALAAKLAASSNLSDLANAASARTNLGLGTLATQSGTFSGTSSGTNTGDQDLSALAPKANPVFTGAVTLPTPFTLGAVSVLPTGTELNFVDGVTSSIQTQLDGKQPSLGFTAVPNTRQVNGHALSGDVSVTPTDLGLVIGTHVQAFSPRLAEVAVIGTPLQQVRVNGGATALEYFTPPASASGANPSAPVGLTAVNGSASTFMRSDGAPALDVGIAPTWTGIHTWGSGLARMASPQITTGLFDANGLQVLGVTAAGSAINSVTVGNAASGSNPFIQTTTNVLEQRSGTSVQTWRLYQTYTSPTNYSRFYVEAGSNYAALGLQAAGASAHNNDILYLSNAIPSGSIQFQTGGATGRWDITGTGHLLATSDNTYDIGASAATRPRNIFIAGNGTFGGNIVSGTAGKGLQLQSGTGARGGEATLVGGTVTVTNTTVGANTFIYLQRRVSGGTIGMALTYTKSNGVSFTINSDNILDASTVAYFLIEVN